MYLQKNENQRGDFKKRNYKLLGQYLHNKGPLNI